MDKSLSFGRIIKATVLYLAFLPMLAGDLPAQQILSGILDPQPTPYVAPTFNLYGYGFNTSTVSATVNTVTAQIASGNISVTNNDLLIGYGQGITASDTTVTMSSSPSTTWTAIAPNLTGTIEFGELSYANAPSTSAAFNATFTTQTATINIGGTVLDFTCTCTFVTSYNFTPAATGTITITGITATAGAHGLLAVMCADAGSSSRTWTVGTINGVTATIAGSSSATATTGAVACEYITSATSFSSASASITQSQPLQTPTATIAIWSY